MRIMVNGRAEDINRCSILEYLKRKEIRPESVVVEHNRTIVKKERWENIRLKENDNLEILGFVGGG